MQGQERMLEEFEVTLNDLVFGGDAIGRMPDGRAVFVPYGLPGERVRVVITEEKGSYARGRIIEMLESSPRRVQPRCLHFGECGGCSYQHMSYADQLEVKRQIVTQQLKRLARLDGFPVAPVVPSPEEWNYRNSLQFHLSTAGKVGFQAASSNRLVEISECHLPSSGISALWPQLELDPVSGIQRVQVREGLDGEMIIRLESNGSLPADFSVDFPISVVFSSADERFVLSGDEFVLMQVKERFFRVSIASFFQANLGQAENMVNHVLALAGDLSGKTVLDAYCGVGLFSAFLAPKAARLVGIEVSESSCSDFAVNMDEFDNVELYIDQVENVLPALDIKPDVAVVDPPRAGLDARVVDVLCKAKPKQIVYVSCDPATLARDIKRFSKGGYKLKSVTPFDQFPQTQHIECIAELFLSD